MMMMVVVVVAALVAMWGGGGFIATTEAARVAPWSMMAKHFVTRHYGRQMREAEAEAEEELPPLAEQEKVMALREDMDAANRELMAADPYYTHW